MTRLRRIGIEREKRIVNEIGMLVGDRRGVVDRIDHLEVRMRNEAQRRLLCARTGRLLDSQGGCEVPTKTRPDLPLQRPAGARAPRDLSRCWRRFPSVAPGRNRISHPGSAAEWRPAYSVADGPTELEREVSDWWRADIRVPLGGAGWQRTSGNTFETSSAVDWTTIERQSGLNHRVRQAMEVLAVLESSKDEPSYGWQTNNHRHSLQSATLALRDGADEEMVVLALLHDIGQTLAPSSSTTAPTTRPPAAMLEKFRGHPAFQITAYFCEKCDRNAIEPDYGTLPIAAFEPMVYRFFRKPQRFQSRRRTRDASMPGGGNPFLRATASPPRLPSGPRRVGRRPDPRVRRHGPRIRAPSP
jgi:hypothetical protein